MTTPTSNGMNCGESGFESRELEQIVLNFRVYELQHLLGYANRCRTGKKPELLQRALELVRTTKNLAVQQKVRELARRVDRSSTIPSECAPGTGANGYAAPLPYSPTANYGAVSSSNGLTSPPATIPNQNVQMASAILQSAHRQNLDLHPNAKLVPLPFYDVLAEVVKPTTLVPMTTEKFQDNYITFPLSQNQMTELAFHETTPLPRVELLLRFCLLDTNVEQKDDFPSGCSVRMNDKPVLLPNPIPTNKVGVEPKRPSRPVNITANVRSNACMQRLHVTWNHDGSRHWTASLYIVRHVTSDMLLQRLQSKGERPSSLSISMIKEKLSGDGDCDIAATSIRVSLLCPLGKMRMRLPCRLHQCNHLQCFDGELFLRMNEKKPTWTCPVCDKHAPFTDLQVDGYFLDVMEKTNENECEVELYEDGGWTAVAEKEETSPNEKRKLSEQNGGEAVNEMSDSATPSSSSVRAASAETTASSSTTAKQCSTENDLSVIDLTEEDSDDDRPAGSSSGASYPSSAPGWRNGSSSARAGHGSAGPSSSTSPCVIVLDSPSPRPIGTPEDPRLSRATTWSRSNGQPCAREATVSPPKKRYAAAGYETGGHTSQQRADEASSFAAYRCPASSQSGTSFGCGIPLLQAVTGLDYNPGDAFSLGQFLAAGGNQLPTNGGGLPSGSTPSNIFGLGPPPLRFGPPASNYLMNSAVFGSLTGYPLPADFLATASTSAAALAAAAAASNMVTGQPTDSVWDNRWSQDFQDFLNSCLPDSSSGPS